MDHMVEIEAYDDWILFHRPDVSKPPWQNFWLTREGAGSRAKRSLYIGWNGERLAENHDTKWLDEHEPQIAAWVFRVCEERFPS